MAKSAQAGGFVSGLLNAVVDWFTGKDIGDHIYAALFGDKEEAKTDTIVAQTRDDSVMPAVTPASAQAALASPETSVAAPPVDGLDKDAARASQTQLPPLSSLTPRLIPDVVEQAALSGFCVAANAIIPMSLRRVST